MIKWLWLRISARWWAKLQSASVPCMKPAAVSGFCQHYTEMVGCKCAITINWIGTADKLIEQEPSVARFRNSFEKS